MASNAAVVAAFESVLGREILVHPWNRISGAVGAALAARAGGAERSAFKGFRAPVPRMTSFECRRCPNRCEVNLIRSGGQRAFFGDTCERYTSGAPDADPRVPDLAAAYTAHCEGLFTEGSGLRSACPGPPGFWGSCRSGPPSSGNWGTGRCSPGPLPRRPSPWGSSTFRRVCASR